ncbi:MAG TPA: alpha/beta hydrolase [Ktedonobacteraceae bacterium]|nr:alpha/beta hydrolase [Ktedonobacteraceae bacterium]
MKTKSGYANAHGLEMYYEIHGEGSPLLLLHGALSTIGISFGKVLPDLASGRQVIAIEQQAHGHTADIDRPLTYAQMADDTAALLSQLGIESTDLFGYSMGAGIAMQLAIRHPKVVQRLVAASVTYNQQGFHPEFLAGAGEAQPEDLAGSLFQEEYARVAPKPHDWPRLFARVNQLDREIQDWRPETIASIKIPTLLIIGDSDIVRPEHAVELFRLLGGGVAGDLTGLPRSQLAVLPGTTHMALMERSSWLVSMITQFLDGN